MEYLRNLGSAAVSSLVQKSGLNTPFSVGTKIANVDGIFSLYDGTKRDDGSPVSIFEYEFGDSSRRNIRTLAQNSLRKLRTTRHPDVLKYMDAVETDTSIHIMTERIKPLPQVLESWITRNAQEREDWLVWGLHRISVAVTFINDPCGSTHGKVNLYSIFISPSGEWKLGGFELLSSVKDESPTLYTLGSVIPGSSSWASPEVKKNGWSSLKELQTAAADSYAVGLLLHAVFNPNQSPPETSRPPTRGAMPAAIFPFFKQLVNPNAKLRLTVKSFLEGGMAEGNFFATNRLVKVCSGLDNFSLSNEAEKTTFLRVLGDTSTSLPTEFTTHRVLPSLLSALEFGGASAASVLPLIIKFGSNILPDEYPNVILTPIIKLFASPDRGTRMTLLEHLPDYIDKLDKKAVSEKIFPHLQTGFADTVAVIREATTKSIILLVPKLTDRILNNDLLRLLAKMQLDPEPSIRTNTCILLGRLGPTLGYNTKRKVLVPAFSRALKDTFVHARVAGLMSFMATIDCFETDDIATKVIPNIAFTMIDKEKIVRDHAFKAVDLFVKRLENEVASMPETALTDGPGDPSVARGAGPDTIVNSAAGAASALAGWAMSSLGRQLATSDLTSTIGPGVAAILDRSNSAPIPATGGPLRPTPVKMTTTSSVPSTPSSTFIAKGMQLGASKSPSSFALSALADDTPVVDNNPWGGDNLIDIFADDGDWSTFETAPVLSHSNPVSTSSLEHIPSNDRTLTPISPTPPLQGNGVQPISKANVRSNTMGSALPPPMLPTFVVQSEKTPTALYPISSMFNDSGGRNGGWGNTKASDTQSMPIPPATREVKAAEFARRKEERKQRIAMLKEQKKDPLRS